MSVSTLSYGPSRVASGVCATGLRLTRRGRLALAVVAAALVAAVVVTGARVAWAASVGAGSETTQVTVLPGQTLWSIATDVAPGSDRRDTVIEIRELNGLPDSQVFAGQVLTVPLD